MGETSGNRVARTKAVARRWELEIAMLGDYGLMLPPETEPLDASRREDHLRVAAPGFARGSQRTGQGQVAVEGADSGFEVEVVEDVHGPGMLETNVG